MTTIHDFSDGYRSTSDGSDLLTLESFLAARVARRHAEAARLARLRAQFAHRIKEVQAEHLRRAERLFHDPALSRSERAELLAHHRTAMWADVDQLRRQRDATAQTDHPTTGFGRWLRARNQTNADRRDFIHVLKASYEDGGHGFDPVLLAIPRGRRRREGAMTIYSVSDGRADREVFRVLTDTNEIVMRATDEISLEAAIVKAHHDFGAPLRFESHDSDFVSRCEAIAARYGFAVAAPTQSAPSAAAGSASPTRDNGSGAAATAAASPVTARVPEIDVDAHAAFCNVLRADHGIDYFPSLSPTSKLTLNGRFLGADPHPDDPSILVSAIETANGAALVALDRTSIENIVVGSVITLRGIDGTWQVACLTVETTAPEPGLTDERQRGR